MRVLELFSGIGGMHFALSGIYCIMHLMLLIQQVFLESNVTFEIVTAIDINTTANMVYEYNFPKTKVLNKNIQGLTVSFINNLNVDTILMSPPCQPFTRNGLKKDIEDSRSCAFLHLLDMLPQLNIQNILLENVKGFEVSNMRHLLIQQLEKSQFTYQEFILSPHQFGIPNTRHRYYCLAKKLPAQFSFQPGQIVCIFKLYKILTIYSILFLG